ncbi:MAG: hypothetical protein ABI877_13145, partial [Gemmatimonadaceae bacterium]
MSSMSALIATIVCAAASFSIAGCSDAVTPTAAKMLSVSSTGSIVDALRGGSPHFYLLPPIVGAPRTSGTFDGALSPTVEICALVNGACAAPLVATFTRATGPGSETVRVNAVDQNYSVNWQTGAFGVDLTTTYRIRILVVKTELGHADVRLVNNGAAAKNLATGDVITLVDGRTLPIKFRIEQGAVAVVGPGGGVANLNDGAVTLAFPSGALPEGTAVTATAVQPGTPAAPDGSVLAGTQYEFQPSPTTFASPVTLALSYPATLPPKWHADRLTICKIVGGACVPLSGASVNLQARTVSAPISGFSSYGVTEFPEVAYGNVTADLSLVQVRLHTASGERVLHEQPAPSIYAVWANWAPDGSRLVHTQGSHCEFRPYVCDTDIHISFADGISPGTTFTGPSRYFDPQWSPDGASILVAALPSQVGVLPATGVLPLVDDADYRAIYSIISPGGTVTASFFAELPIATWSHDGQRVFFQGAIDAGRRNCICAINRDGTGLTPLVEDFIASRLSASPDGTRIAMLGYSELDGQKGVYVVGTDGTGFHRILRTGELMHMSGWSPDVAANSILLWENGEDDQNFDPEDNHPIGMYTLSGDGVLRHLISDRLIRDPTWSPDGNRIVLFDTGNEAAGPAIVTKDGAFIQFIETGELRYVF